MNEVLHVHAQMIRLHVHAQMIRLPRPNLLTRFSLRSQGMHNPATTATPYSFHLWSLARCGKTIKRKLWESGIWLEFHHQFHPHWNDRVESSFFWKLAAVDQDPETRNLKLCVRSELAWRERATRGPGWWVVASNQSEAMDSTTVDDAEICLTTWDV